MSSREISYDLARGSHSELLLNTLKSRYPCFHEPLTLAAAAADATSDDDDDDDKKYLTSLWVFGNRQVDEPESPLPPSFSNLMVDQNITDPHMIKEKIASVLKVLRFREQRVLVQFWSPVSVRKRWLLTTWDQPFGLGVADEGLYQYRINSERRAVVVDEEYRDELGPVGRVYSQKRPEWSLDVQGWDTSYNIHGYIDLPLFESSGGSCVGILEIITSSNYVDYAFEVLEVSRALKKQNLKFLNMFEDPSFCVANERRQHELDEIYKALKTVCDVQNLPLAQTWALSGKSSYVTSSGILKQCCSSFNRSCIGKVCMLTSDLPFYVRDLSMWGFRDSSKETHLEKSRGVVGRSLAYQGACFCENVTELDEQDYPLALIARMSGLTSCLAIYLKSLKLDVEYVIELFLPPSSTNEADLLRIMTKVKQQINNNSDIMWTPQVIKVVPLYLESHPSPITLLTEKGEVPLPESEYLQPIVENEQNDADVTFSKKQNEVVYLEHREPDNIKNEPSNSTIAGTSPGVTPYLEKGVGDFDIDPGRTKRKYSDISKGTRKKRKRSESSISLEEIKKYFGKTMDEAAALLNVSRSTLKRICRNLGIPRWPYRNAPADKSDSRLKSDHTEVIVHGEEGALTTVVGASVVPFGISNITHDPVSPTELGKHSSTLVLDQHEETNLSDVHVEPHTAIRGKFIRNITANAVKPSTIKATYRENIVKFSFSLSDGLVKLEELVATRFQLGLGSFSLKYVDEDGDKISIVCDNDLTVISTAFRHLDNALIRLVVELVTDQNSNA